MHPTIRILGRFCIALKLGVIVSAQTPTAAQTIWFCPTVPESWNQFKGSGDYLDLFVPGAPWTMALSHVQVFKMYTQMIDADTPGSFSDATLRQIFAFLNSHNIALALEFGPLTPTASPGYGMGVEGFGSQAAIPVATRISQLGGTLEYLAFDEPIFFGSLYTGSNACNWTAQQVAANAVQTVGQIKTVFPNVKVGDIEPVPATVYARDWLNQYAAWVDAWRDASGEPFAFFHFDVNWTVDWQQSVENLRETLIPRHIPFGIIYNGWLNDSTDASWIDDAQSHYAEWEAQGGTLPDHVIFQSWYANPQHTLPESDPTAFTYLIDSYFRERTKLSLTAASTLASGTLANSEGAPIASASIAFTAQPATGPGTVANYVLSGTVPPSVAQAVIQTCVNECGEVGTTDINVYSFQYVIAGGQSNFSFADGLTGWSVDGNGTAKVVPSSDANGKSLQISATTDQQTFVNSTPFTVMPGSNYQLAVQARVSPSSAGSGYFAIVFLNSNETEISRDTLPFAPATVQLGTALTGSDGTYYLSYAPVDPAGSQIQAVYSGTSDLWPAFASGALTTSPYVPANGIVNGADFELEPLAAETWFTIFGLNLGTAGEWTNSGIVSLGGASVSVCSIPAAISYNSGPVDTNGTAGWQINALVPTAVAGLTNCPVVVTVNGETSPPVAVNIASGIMELFSFPSSVGSLPVITHADYSLVGPSIAGLKPAQPGETVIAWGTGDCSTPSVTVSGLPSTVTFAGGIAPGLCQFNFQVPVGSSGSEELLISTSPGTYSLSVSSPR